MGYVDRVKIDGFKAFYRYIDGYDGPDDTYMIVVYVNEQHQFVAGLKNIWVSGNKLSKEHAAEARAVTPKDYTWDSGKITLARERLQMNNFDLEEE